MPTPEVLLQSYDTRIARYTISHADGIVPHYHTQVNDFIYCLLGSVVIETDKTTVRLTAGMHSVIAAGVPHRVTTTDTAAVYLLVQHGGAYDFIPCTTLAAR